MKTKLLSLWESVHTSFWFLPTVMALAAIGLSVGMVRLDRSISVDIPLLNEFLYPGGAEGARLVLSTIAGSMITVAGVTFSITIVALTLASSQFGPRLLRSFMADKGNQVVLGTFVGTFIYCLLVLRTVQGADRETAFVPELAVTVGIVLALAGFGVLIYFFHHASTSIQSERVVDTVYRELISEINRTFPETPAQAEPVLVPVEQPGELGTHEEAITVAAVSSGYLRAIDTEGLMSLATAHDLVIRLVRRPGDFIFEQTPLARVAGGGEVDSYIYNQVQHAFVLGTYRSLKQDVEFPIQQLVDMALRALSPSLNDPYTAMNCIDRLGAGICHLNARHSPPRHRYDQAGRLRLIVDVYTYEGIVDAAFNQIRQNARRSVAVNIRLLETLQAIAATARRDEQRKVIRRHAEMIHRAGREAAREESDRNDLEERFQEVLQKLGTIG